MSGEFLILRSSAGSGKTYQLAKNYVKIVLATPANGGEHNPDYFRHILALTFTKAAAEEMKGRILKFLRGLGSFRENGNPAQRPEFEDLLAQIKSELSNDYPEFQFTEQELGKRAHLAWKRILHQYSEFSVQTIDSFVNAVSKSFYRDLGLAFNFQISFDQDELLEESVDNFFNDLAPDSEWAKWIHQFFQYQRESDSSWRVRYLIIDFAKKILPYWKKAIGENKSATSEEEFAALKKRLQERVKILENQLKSLAKEGIGLMEKYGLTADHFDYKRQRGLGIYFERVHKNGFGQGEFKLDRYKEDGKELFNKDAPGEVIARSGDIEEAFFKVAEALNDFLIRNRSDYLLAKNSLRAIHQLALMSQVIEGLNTKKEEDGIIFLDDLQELIKGFVLEEPVPFIFERVGIRFRHILIDEFQDTSETQWVNLLPLISNGLAQGMENLVVGDAKQSIYSWRGGDPQLLVDLPGLPPSLNSNRLLNEHLPPLVSNKREVVMKTNYRSLPDIVSFNNRFFEWLIQDVEDHFPTIREYYQNHIQDPAHQNGGEVRFYQIANSEGISFETEALSLLPHLIEQKRNEGFDFPEIAVLVRKNEQARKVLELLLNNGIPAISNESLFLSSSSAVNSFVSFVRFLLNPSDQFSRWELVKNMFSTQSEKIPKIGEVKRLLKASEVEFWAWFSDKFAKGVKLDFILHDSVYTMLERFMRRFGLSSLEQHKPFLFSFLDYAFHFSLKRNSGLRDFLDDWNEKKEKLSVTIGEESPGVQIMTIHKSKGLEFGAVILPFLSWDTTKTPDFLAAEIEDHELGIFGVNKDLEQTRIADQYLELRGSTFIESVNLLYVAMTRATESLVGIFKGPKKEGEPGTSISNIEYLFQRFFVNQENDSKNHEFGEKQVQVYAFGSIAERKISGKEPIEKCDIDTSPQSQEKPWIDIKVDQDWKEGEGLGQRPREFGIVAHKYLERIDHIDDLAVVLEQVNADPDLDLNERERLSLSLTALRENETLLPFFQEKSVIYNEQSLVSENGSFRPDRIVFSDNHWRILDYKTGKKSKDHEAQLNLYGKLLQDSLGLAEAPKKCILYLQADGKLDPVIFN